jgi:hypothetical protein
MPEKGLLKITPSDQFWVFSKAGLIFADIFIMFLTSKIYLLGLLQIGQAGDPLPEDVFRTDWLFALLILPFFLYILVVFFERFPVLRMARIVTSNSYAYFAFRDKGVGTQASQVLLGIISIITISTFAYFIELHYRVFPFDLSGFRLWMLNMVIFTVSIFFRIIVCYITGIITGSREAFSEYIFNVLQIYKFLSVLLLIINFFVSYMVIIADSVLIITGITLIAITLALRVFRLFSIFIRCSFSLYYLILYLCALEFTPVLIFIKYLSGKI